MRVGVHVEVSIRSPHKSKGRPRDREAVLFGYAVSIRSPHKSKGRLYLLSEIVQVDRGFNPLPSQKQGETPSGTLICPAPCVSIRSPHKSKGRLLTQGPKCIEGKFQSAPLTKARGDRRLPAHPHPVCRFNPLPSQKQGETIAAAWIVSTETVSIRSPHKSKGRPSRRGRLRGWWMCFNPLPSQKQGETNTLWDVKDYDWVSIRSPHKSKGRQADEHSLTVSL